MVQVRNTKSPEYGSEIHEPIDEQHDDKVIVPTPNARQGVEHHNVRVVLVVSLLGVVAVMVLAYIFVL
jgi:hypothetical protein